jgi:hypothetical protein
MKVRDMSVEKYTIAVAVSQWLLTMAAWVQSQAIFYGICGTQSSTGASLNESTSAFPANYHEINAVFLPPVIHDWYNAPFTMKHQGTQVSHCPNNKIISNSIMCLTSQNNHITPASLKRCRSLLYT